MPVDPIRANPLEDYLYGDSYGTNNEDIPIVGGCMDPRAYNYDNLATYDDGSCLYDPLPVDTSNIINLTILGFADIGFRSSPTGASIYVNGIDSSKTTSDTIRYGYKELLTAKVFSLQQSGFESEAQYRVRTKIKTISYNTGYLPWLTQSNPNFDIIIEKLVDGVWMMQPSPTSINAIINKITPITLDFDLTEVIIQHPIDLIPVINKHKIVIRGDVATNGIIKYTLSDGQNGFVLDNTSLDFTVLGIEDEQLPWAKFERVGITELDHKVQFTVTIPQQATPSVFQDDFTVQLSQGTTYVDVIANKLIELPAVNTPIISVTNDVLQYNVANSRSTLSIPYTSMYADGVNYSLGTSIRKLKDKGTITLTGNDFNNGLGQYTVYLQPYSNINGTGEVKRIIINVISRAFLPGPDITHITYPENIKGADFKGYDEDFKISWQSINSDYVQIYVSKVDNKFALAKTQANGTLTFNVADVLRKGQIVFNENTDIIKFSLILIPYSEAADKLTKGKEEKITILFDKGDLRLRRAQVIADIQKAFNQNLNEQTLQQEISKYLTHYVHFGDADNKLISTWAIDRETFSEYVENETNGQLRKVKEVRTLVLKLYEPLPNSIQPNAQLWMSKLQSIPIINQVTLNDDDITECIMLTPNFKLDVGDDIGYQILDDLVASGSVSSTQLVEQFIGTNQFSLAQLNLQYVSGSEYLWDNFIKYSSAVERVENFFYKVKAIEYHEATIENLLSGSSSGSISTTNEVKRTEESIYNVKKGFDAFEQKMYSVDTGLSFPGAGYTELSGSTSAEAESWYTGIIASAQEFDEYNDNALVNNIPLHVKNDSQGQDFVMFFNMIGQHFDVLTSYTQGIIDGKKLTHNNNDGITNELIYHMLESLGWDADMGVKSQYLWEYAFGKSKDGVSVSDMSGKDRQLEIWRRLLNNLPYIYKYKGTRRALNAAMACYGVPSSMLTIMEFGGPVDASSGGTTSFTFDDRTAALSFSGTEYLEVPWTAYTGSGAIASASFGPNFPNTLEIRLNTESRTQQTIFRSEGFEIVILPGTGSQASIGLALFQDTTGSFTDADYVVSSSYFPMFNEEYTQIAVTRTLSGSSYVYDVYGKEGYNERIRNEGYGQLIVPETSDTWYYTTAPLYIGGSPVGSGLIGTVDEFRLWSTPLDENRIENHALLPDAIDGNHVSASTADLIFRNDFEYPKDRSSGGDVNIKNVSINYGYEVTSSIAVGFPSVTEYPYQYVPYERTVTAVVPASGISFSNKIRFESQTLENYLKFGSTSNVSSFDNAKDSNKLGLFFSPIKEVNMDILKSLGQFNIDDYIGNPADEYNYDYNELANLRNYYFDRFTLNIYEYIQLVRYIDQTIFTTLESLVPGRAKVSSGLLIEPHILERSKVKRTKPIAEDLTHEVTINADNDTNLFGTFNVLDTTLDVSDEVILDVVATQMEATIDASLDGDVSGEKRDWNALIIVEDDVNLIADYPTYEVSIDASYTGSLSGQYDSTTYIQVNMDPDSISARGFGIVGTDGHVLRTYKDVFGNMLKERIQVYRIKEQYTEDVPQNINSSDPSLGREFVTQTFYKYKVTFLPYGSPAPGVTGDVVEVVPLNGYYPSHYRNVGDLPSGMQNSWYNGSKQTSSTTLDGLSPVETFTTNPNTLRVNESGRGSAEPILEVD